MEEYMRMNNQLSQKMYHLAQMQVEMVNALIPYKQKLPTNMDKEENMLMLKELRKIHQNAKIVSQWIKNEPSKK